MILSVFNRCEDSAWVAFKCLTPAYEYEIPTLYERVSKGEWPMMTSNAVTVFMGNVEN